MTPDSNPTWYILGAGAIGCLWASYWRQAGFPVTLISRSAALQNSIELTTAQGQTSIDVQVLTAAQAQASGRTIENLLVTTKAQQTLAAIGSIKRCINSDTTVLVVQNGMAIDEVAPLLGGNPLFAGITTDGAYRTAAQSVVHAGRGLTTIGACGDKADPSQLLQLMQKLPTAHLRIESCNDIAVRQWKKLAINCAINGLTVFYQCKNGELLNRPQALVRIKNICQEAQQVAEQLGLAGHLATLYQDTLETLRSTAENYSSMYQDVDQGRSTEIEYINGYLCRQAASLGLSCPENQSIYDYIIGHEQQ